MRVVNYIGKLTIFFVLLWPLASVACPDNQYESCTLGVCVCLSKVSTPKVFHYCKIKKIGDRTSCEDCSHNVGGDVGKTVCGIGATYVAYGKCSENKDKCKQ
jgi:hypothetical protein